MADPGRGLDRASLAELTNKDLDECHGTVSRVWWDGHYVRIYHYVLTAQFPYSIGCFRGTPVKLPPQFS